MTSLELLQAFRLHALAEFGENVSDYMIQDFIKKTKKMSYINNPQTLEEAANNAKFQCDNVSSWLYLKDYKSAMIKAECLMEAMRELFSIIEKNEKETPRWRS